MHQFFFSHAKGEGKMATKAGITVVLAKWIFVEVTGHEKTAHNIHDYSSGCHDHSSYGSICHK